LREAIAEARKQRHRGHRTVLFIDEIHRYNKAQQDALLQAVENGTVPPNAADESRWFLLGVVFWQGLGVSPP